MTGRRSTDSNASQPAMKVVGFHVEGVPPSPGQNNLLQGALVAGGGSPDPVIIPPSFQSVLSSDNSRPTSPQRLNTIPCFVPEVGKQDMQDVFGSKTARIYPGAPSAEARGGRRGLAHTGSLPPMSSDVTADWKQFAASMARVSPPQLSPRTQREVRSQPASTAVTPPVSPYYSATDRPVSSSYRQSAFEVVQNLPLRRDELPHLAATYSDGGRVRPIQVHMGGNKLQYNDPIRHDIGTPRQQHGFQIQPNKQEAGSSKGGTAGPPQPQTVSTGASSSAALPGPPHDHESPRGSSPRRRSDLPAVPEASATPEKATPTAGKESRAVQRSPEQPGGKQRGEASIPKPEGGHRDSGPAREGQEKKKPTKAERRALQEKQRAAKAAAKDSDTRSKPGGQQGGGAAQRRETGGEGPSSSRAGQQPASTQPTLAAAAKPSSKSKSAKSPVSIGQTSEMFAHLPQYRAIGIENVFQDSSVASKVHPAVVRLGLQYTDGTITGSNARCLAMLLTFKIVIKDYQTPESKELSRDLTSQLNLCIQFLVECRPLSVSMGNAIKNLKLKVSHMSTRIPQEEAKAVLMEEIDTFIQEKITFADEQVARLARSKVASGDVVLTYAFSSAVLNTFLSAKREGKDFRVVVVDSRPHYEGRAMLSKLLANGIPCTYVQLNALCFIMQEVTKVFMGASGAMSNGTIFARAGSASVAMAAHAMRRPVIVCCETLKFVDRVQLDSITYNELGDPNALASVDGFPEIDALKGWQDQANLELLNLIYDAMPGDYVTVIITEVGAIPPTSIPVVLREYQTEPKL